jgi:hypothetical protein
MVQENPFQGKKGKWYENVDWDEYMRGVLSGLVGATIVVAVVELIRWQLKSPRRPDPYAYRD